MQIAVTGCFDVLHIGHIRLCRFAHNFGRVIVGINSDAAVRQLKGPSRPINNQFDRREALQTLRWVDEVIIFDSLTVCEFLLFLRPDAWLKGGGYSLQTLNQKEVAVARKIGCEIVLFPATPGLSTTSVLAKMS
jgi:rfaE bifunctional protein nucleotidyltransferase chain/domain